MTTSTQEEPAIDVLTHEVAVVKRQAAAILITDDATEQAAMLMIAKCRENEKKLEEERKAQTDPLRTRIEIITEPYKKAAAGFEAIRKKIDGCLQAYRAKKARELQEQQQKAIEDKRRQEAEAQAEAAKQREKAEKLEREAAEKKRALSAAEQKKLDDQRVLAQAAQEKAAEVAAAPVEVVVPQAKTTTLGDGTQVTSRAKKGWVFKNGLPKDTVFYRDDPRFKDVSDSFFKFDPTKMNLQAKIGAAEGVLIVDEAVTAIRQAK